MKYVKLFEEFKFDKFKDKTVWQLKLASPYEIIKNLPPFGYCEVDEDESIAIQVELLRKGCNNFTDYASPQKYYHNVLDPKGKNLIVWNGKRREISIEKTFKDIESYDIVNSRVYYGYDGMTTPPPFKLIEFDDYFKAKDSHKGYIISKKFGL